MIVCMCNAKNTQTVRETLAGAPHVDTPAGLHRPMVGCSRGYRAELDRVAGLIEDARSEAALVNLLAAAD